MGGLVRAISGSLALAWAAGGFAAEGRPAQDPGRLAQIERIQQQEGETVIALADAAMAGRSVPAEFALAWHNDFLKAQQGTFVPFVVSMEAERITTPAVLLYLRATPRRQPADASRILPAFEDVYPVDVPARTGWARVTRGFAIAPGEYDLVIVARERVDPAAPERPRRAAVRREPLNVPDFRPGELTTSSIILADRQEPLPRPATADELPGRPYAIGSSEIEPSVDRRFARHEELIVVFLVYNSTVTPEKQFDLEVEYHFFREGVSGSVDAAVPERVRSLARAGERYFNHTRPQRFTPESMGSGFDPAAGPIMAGQGVPLSGFPEGTYRLAVRIADMISGASITRDVTFTVAGH